MYVGLFGVWIKFCWGLCLGLGLGEILIGMLYERGILGDILFICVGFIGGLGRVGELDWIGERWCGDGVFCCGSWGVSLGRE